MWDNERRGKNNASIFLVNVIESALKIKLCFYCVSSTKMLTFLHCCGQTVFPWLFPSTYAAAEEWGH